MSIKQKIIDSKIWRSMFPGGIWKKIPKDRIQHIFGNLWLHIQPIRISPRAIKFTYTWGLGGISFLLFLILTITGIYLMFYYRPTIEHAYNDMKDLEFAVSYGMFLRNLHRWSAHAMVICVILHMLRVFLTSAYKSPRAFNWVVGVILLVLTLLLSFTGYLLPWDQLAMWAITVGTNMASAVPFFGAEGPFSIFTAHNDVRFFLLGGTTVGENALLRFYVLHCIGLPFIAGIFMMVHFWRIRKDTFSVTEKDPRNNIDSWPTFIYKEYIAAIITIIIVFIWSIYINAPLEEIANPNRTPNPSKAPWYFVGLQELLVYFDPWIAGVMLPGLIIFGLMVIPYIDPNPNGIGRYSFKDRKFACTVFLFGNILWFVLIGIGQFLRGPNWAWHWLWESWEIHKPPTPAAVNMPNPIGIAILSLYFILGTIISRRFFKNMGLISYAIMILLLLMMFGVPLKICLRLLFNVKYIISFPQFGFNI